MTDRLALPRIPSHLVVMLGASTATYAVTLAGVAGLQARVDAGLAATRQPTIAAISELQAGHDDLAARLAEARGSYTRTANAYEAAGSSLEALSARLGALAATVADIDGASRSMPTSIRLPTVRQPVAAVRAPATHATTGASGG